MRTRGLVNYTSIPPCKRTMIEIAIFPFSNTGLSLLITNTLAMSTIEYVKGLRKEPLPIGTSYSGVCHLCLSLSNEDNQMIFILISSTRKILWLPNYTNAGISIKRLLKLNWKKNCANQIHLPVHLGLGKTGFGRSILHGRSNCWENEIRNVFFQGVEFWTSYVEVACTWEIMEMNLWEMNNRGDRLGKFEGWELVGMKGGHAHKNSCMLGMNEEIC